MKHLLRFCLIALFFSATCNAQLDDIARIDWTILPKLNSTVEYTRIRGLFNYPVKLKGEKTYLLLGLDYSNINLLSSGDNLFNTDALDGFQLLDINIGYTKPLKNDWRLGVRVTPGISTNFVKNGLSFEDFVFSGTLVFIKDKTKDPELKKPWRITAGLSYSQNRGFPFPLPFLVYYKRFHPKWSYKIGIPTANLQYHLSEKHRIKLYAELDGFTSNLQKGLLTDNGEEADRINMGLILGGLQYEYIIVKHVEFFARASYIINQSVQLRDRDNNNIEELDDSNSLYLRTGIRLKI